MERHLMNATQYVLRANYFGYNDECFYVSGTRIQQVFDREEDAMRAWKAHEISSARDFPLYEIASFFDADDDFLAEMDAFVFERCGEHIVQHGEISNDCIPSSLNDDDTFEFVQRARMNAYQVLAFASNSQYYALWLSRTNQYLKSYDEDFSGLIYAESAEKLLNKHLEDLWYQQGYDDNPLIGRVEDLSDSPALLSALIQHNNNIKHSDKTHILSFKKHNTADLIAVNALLKQPLFDVRALSLQAVIDIETALNDNPYGTDDDE